MTFDLKGGFSRLMLGTTKLFPGDVGHEPALTPHEQETPGCPVCGAETWDLVRDRWGDIVGCFACLDVVNAAEGTEQSLGFIWNGSM